MPSRISTAAAAAGFWLCVTVFASTPASATEPIDPAKYPELAPEAVLPAILAELRHGLADVYSVREVRICTATHIKLKDGAPSDWAIRFEYNSKNENGGYRGIQREVAIFKSRRIAYPLGNAPQLSRDGLDGLLSRKVDKQMEACTPIPDATIQRDLASLG